MDAVVDGSWLQMLMSAPITYTTQKNGIPMKMNTPNLLLLLSFVLSSAPSPLDIQANSAFDVT
jgi:hypothetical protein